MRKTIESIRRNVQSSAHSSMLVLCSVLASVLVLQGCSTYPSAVYNGSADCNYIGCSTGGLVVYPHEAYSASVQPRRWYGWEWGKTSSAFHPSDPKHWELKKQECARMRELGLDCQGRPLR